MVKKYIYLTLFVTALSGCEKSTVKEEASVVDVGSPTANAFDSAPSDASAPPPSGTIEVPKGVSTENAAPPVSSDLPENKGVFALPPVTPSNEPVTVKRPVLDDVVTLSDKNAAVVKLTAATLEEIRTAVANSREVCVVDFWSLACEPCLKEFPGLVRLNEELAGKVTCLSVNVDYDGRKSKPAEVYRTRVEGFLQSTGATFPNYLCLTPNEEAYGELKIVSIPAVLIYDAEGKLVRTFTDAGDDIGFSYEKDIAPLVKSLVSQ